MEKHVPAHSPIASCEPQSDDATGTSSNNEVEKALDSEEVTHLYLQLPQDLQLDYATYATSAAF